MFGEYVDRRLSGFMLEAKAELVWSLSLWEYKPGKRRCCNHVGVVWAYDK